MAQEFNPEPSSINQKMWRVKDPKSHETRAQTPALAPGFCGGRGVISVILPPHGFVEHSRWRPTNQSFTFAVESKTKKKKKKKPQPSSCWTGTDLNSPSITCYFLLFYFFTATKMNNQKDPDIWAHFSLYFPFYLWDRNRTTQMGLGELVPSICSSPQERKNKRTPNPKNLN